MVLATTLSFVLLSSVLILFTVAMSRSSEMWHSYGWKKKPAVTRNTVRRGHTYSAFQSRSITRSMKCV